jgi:predicted TIM-barrel fold metal-dependent hydrolase
MASPHNKVREDWLALSQEEVLVPGQPVFDAHHHVWDRPEGRYWSEELMADVGAGHDVRASLYVQCRTSYRLYGPYESRLVSDVETVLDWRRGSEHFPVGLVAMADLQLGDRVRTVLEAMVHTGKGRVIGTRNTTAWHTGPAVQMNFARIEERGLIQEVTQKERFRMWRIKD